MILICEISTNHGGDIGLATEMIHAAAEAGADYAKTQAYDLARLNPADPQRDWLRQAHLDRAAHEQLIAVAQAAGIAYLSTPFDSNSLTMLRELGLTTFKIASSESGHDWWEQRNGESWFVSYPWGIVKDRRPPTPTFHGSILHHIEPPHTHLTAIPLYPTPLECVGKATMLDGYSCHAVGNDAALWAIAQGISVLEVHLTLGKGRVCAWDRTPAQIAELRRFADSAETMRSGVSTQYRTRWTHGA